MNSFLGFCRIPARKKNPPNYFNNLPSPRAELLVAPSISMFPKRPSPLKSEKSTEKAELSGEAGGKSDNGGEGDDDEEEDAEDDEDDDDLIIVASSDEEGDGESVFFAPPWCPQQKKYMQERPSHQY